jgi:hypothetical protein
MYPTEVTHLSPRRKVRSMPTSQATLWRVELAQPDGFGTQARFTLDALRFALEWLEARGRRHKRICVQVSARCWYEPAFLPSISELFSAHAAALPRLLIEIEHDCLLKSATNVRSVLARANGSEVKLAVRLGHGPMPLCHELREAGVVLLIADALAAAPAGLSQTECLFLERLANAAGAELELDADAHQAAACFRRVAGLH